MKNTEDSNNELNGSGSGHDNINKVEDNEDFSNGMNDDSGYGEEGSPVNDDKKNTLDENPSDHDEKTYDNNNHTDTGYSNNINGGPTENPKIKDLTNDGNNESSDDHSKANDINEIIEQYKNHDDVHNSPHDGNIGLNGKCIEDSNLSFNARQSLKRNFSELNVCLKPN